jgi:hypothetical protein
MERMAGSLRLEAHTLIRLAAVLHERERQSGVRGQRAVAVAVGRSLRSPVGIGACEGDCYRRGGENGQDRQGAADHRRRSPTGVVGSPRVTQPELDWFKPADRGAPRSSSPAA